MKESGFLAVWLAIAGFWDIIKDGAQFVFMGLLFTFLKVMILGDRTPRQAFMAYLTGSVLGTTVGISMQHMGFNPGTIYLTVAGVVMLSENILRAVVQVGQDLEKDPQGFVARWASRWVGGKKDDVQ
jgi:hypothetical protein